MRLRATLLGLVVVAGLGAAIAEGATGKPADVAAGFRVEEATLADIQAALAGKRITTVGLVKQYLARIKAYNGTCVKQPQGVLGPVTTIPNAGQINALSTINLRPAARKQWGFDEHKARSLTDAVDTDPSMPDALEQAAAQDAKLGATGTLVGPLHGMILAIKDQFDTRDLRTTSGADAPYANDRPPRDSTFVTKLVAAGAIVIGKANMGEYASGDRSSFGGVFCNPYDTERSPGRSSGGSGSVAAANLATCAIGEESGPSIRNPAKNNNVVGVAATQELVSRAGIVPASYLNDRVGPLCRTVADAAKIFDVIKGFDPLDPLTAFSVGRIPTESFASAAIAKPLAGKRIGVLREYMNRDLFTIADAQTIDLIEREIDVLKGLGATIVDPGARGALFQSCIAKLAPGALNSGLTTAFPKLFPVDGQGKPGGDHVPLLVAMASGSKPLPEELTIRGIGGERSVGESRYVLEAYLAARGDANIRTVEDLVEKSRFYGDVRDGTGFSDKKKNLEGRVAEKTLDLAGRLQLRFALQQVALQCMAEQQLDAVTYPTGNVPAPKLGAPIEPTVNNRSALAWTLLGAQGFPVISVPAGFTTEVYDRVTDKAAPGGTRLVGPVAAKLPVNIDFLGRPFSESTLFAIAASYEAATHHREAPPGFGPPRVK